MSRAATVAFFVAAALAASGCFLSHEVGVLPAPDAGAPVPSSGCSAASTPATCAGRAGCSWYAADGCGTPPAASLPGPTCLQTELFGCVTDRDCDVPGETCQSLWINPCAGSACEACGSEILRCVALPRAARPD